jgi:hypothetical protein
MLVFSGAYKLNKTFLCVFSDVKQFFWPALLALELN